MLLCYGAVCGGGVWEGTMPLAWLSSWLSVTSPAICKQIGPFWCWFLGGWVCVHSETLWISPKNSPVRLGVSPAATTPTGFSSQRFCCFISLHWNPGLHVLSHSPVVPRDLSTHECRTTQSASRCLAMSPLCPAAHLHPSYQSGWRFLL